MVRYQALSKSSDVLACLLTVTGHMHPSLRGQRSLDPHGGTVRKETTYVGARVGQSHTEPEKVAVDPYYGACNTNQNFSGWSVWIFFGWLVFFPQMVGIMVFSC